MTAPRRTGLLETVRVRVPEAALEPYEAALRSVCESVGLFLDGPLVDGGDGNWIVEGTKNQGEREPELQAALALAAAVSGVPAAASREPVEPEGWLARSFAEFPEQFIGRRFAVRGTHIALPPMSGRITLVLDAALAFGSGEHGSTRGCLRALETVAWRRPRRVIDLGTGTGILAMAAARLLHIPVKATDICRWSVRTARDNARRNGLRNAVSVRRADGWTSPWARAGRPYDLILANILARPLCRMARALASNLAPGGTAILAGLLDRQWRWVAVAHRRHGLVLHKRHHEGDWVTLVMRKPKYAGDVRASRAVRRRPDRTRDAGRTAPARYPSVRDRKGPQARSAQLAGVASA